MYIACPLPHSQMFQPTVERVLVSIMMLGRWARLQTVVKKNLAGHRSRNGKSAYMIALSVGFLLFAGSMFALQANSISNNLRLFFAADIVALSPDEDLEPLPQVRGAEAELQRVHLHNINMVLSWTASA